MKILDKKTKALLFQQCSYQWNRKQIRALIRLMKRFQTKPTIFTCNNQYAGVMMGGMFVGIEKDGYAHT